MLATAYVINFLGMILLPILAWIYFTRKFKLSWKLLLAGGLTFIASQIPHVPLTLVATPVVQSWGLIPFAIALGLLAGIFEETARYILFRFILKKSRSWNEGLFVGLGHGGTEAIILGIVTAFAFFKMLALKNVDLSTVPGIPADQLELAKAQVAAYWSAPVYLALLGMVERIFAVCLHAALSIAILYSITTNKPIWFWVAVAWHAIVDGAAVYLARQGVNVLIIESLVGLLALVGLWTAFNLKSKFPKQLIEQSEQAPPAA